MSVGVASRGPVRLLVLQRPEKLNALDTPTLESLRGALREACREEGVGAVAVTGSGRLFSAGIDLGEVASARHPAEAARPFKALARLVEEMLRCPRPVAAVLNGPAVAGGAELALAADIVYAVGEGVYLSWPEVRWGLVAPMLSYYLRATGSQLLAWAALSGGRLGAGEARALGLISRVVTSVEEALEDLEGVARLVLANEASAASYLASAREGKRRAAAELLPQLEGLAASAELVERARRFLESRRGGG